MKKEVSIFSLGEERQYVEVGQDTIQFYSINTNYQPLPYGRMAVPLNRTIEEGIEYSHLPIHHLVKVEGDVKTEKYIVIKPDIREWLEAPHKEKYMNVLERSINNAVRADKAEAMYLELLSRSLWKRLYWALFPK